MIGGDRQLDVYLNPDFVLNFPRYQEASILVTEKNFGCGSSREHAPWALEDFGFRALIAPSFADIFANNCLKNGVLTVVLTESEVETIVRRTNEQPNYQLTLDLEQCKVQDDSGFSATFQIDDFTGHLQPRDFAQPALLLRRQAPWCRGIGRARPRC